MRKMSKAQKRNHKRAMEVCARVVKADKQGQIDGRGWVADRLLAKLLDYLAGEITPSYPRRCYSEARGMARAFIVARDGVSNLTVPF